MSRRALVSQPRLPEPDRDRGSQRVDSVIQFLQRDGWSVTFISQEESGDQRHAHRLRQHGVATYTGYERAAEVIGTGDFDVAVLAFWKPAAELTRLLRSLSPRTRIIVDSIDVHFLREARREFGVSGGLDGSYGSRMADELNVYHSADAVLTVSENERDLLGAFLGPDRVHCLPLGEQVTRSTVPFEDRRGMLFVGNFRHLPNGEAVEYLCRDVLPRLDPDLVGKHPLTIVGNRLDEKVAAHGRSLRGVRMVGWVPSVIPYLERARTCVMPLLHGAGVKGKVLQAMMLGTPVVTNRIGAEGLGLVNGEHALIAESPGDLAAAAARMLTDRTYWEAIADKAARHARESHDERSVHARFSEILAEVLERPPWQSAEGFRHGRARDISYRRTVDAFCASVRSVTAPGSVVAVVSRGDDELLALDGRTGWHFPQGTDGSWAGHYPADSDAAILDVRALQDRGARYLALPSTSFWWLDHYRELGAHLEALGGKVVADEEVVVYDLSPGNGAASSGAPKGHVLVLGTHTAGQAPPAELVAELQRSQRFTVEQSWSTSTASLAERGSAAGGRGSPADWTLVLDETAALPVGFVDEFLGLAGSLGAERIQAPHSCGPTAGPPITERLLGCTARQVDGLAPLPVLGLRAGASVAGPVWIADALPIRLVRDLPNPGPQGADRVLDVVVRSPDGLASSVTMAMGRAVPRISVLIATYQRPELLDAALAGFCEQTLDTAQFEVVVVDDGSEGDANRGVIAKYQDHLPLVYAWIEHAGRSAAKNLATMLARGELVLYFDDDDRPDSDLLAEHLRMHERHPDEGAAVLGFTDWAPELTMTPLMHFLTHVDKLLFAYGNLSSGQELDWRGFWEGRISAKRSLVMGHALHDQRLQYSIDVEMALRLAPHCLRVIYDAAARSVMSRPLGFADFCHRIEAKGRAQALMASLHPGPDVRRYARVDQARERWEAAEPELAAMMARVQELEGEVEGASEDPARLSELHKGYRAVFEALYDKGICQAEASSPSAEKRPGKVQPAEITTSFVPARSQGRGSEPVPLLTVTIPVWSRTSELADMAERTVDRLWSVASLPIEVIVVDNGSPHFRELRATMHRFDENRGVATAWNTGIGLAKAPVVAVLNSDCMVEPGWDLALYEAVRDGSRVAFPYTDHGDGLGFRQPDQGGTAGWCFMLTREVLEAVGPFDERFNPAYGEDTDYWHRVWEQGIELSPVPEARVCHARRTTARLDPHLDWLIQSHRYLYGWKHGVDPLRAPPYYNRAIVEYSGRRGAEGVGAA